MNRRPGPKNRHQRSKNPGPWTGVPGAADAKSRADAWEGVLIFSNIGLAGEAIRGPNWERYKSWLQRFIWDLFSGSAPEHAPSRKVLGLLLGEVGNLSDRVVGQAKNKFNLAMQEAIVNVSNWRSPGQDHQPDIQWTPKNGECVGAFLPCAKMSVLPQMTYKDMPELHEYRVMDRFIVRGGPEHKSPTLLVYHQHQPSSTSRPFPHTMRISLCKRILMDATHYCRHEDSKCIGFVVGGDLNCAEKHWNPAMYEVPGWRDTFAPLSYLEGINHRDGDFMVAGRIHDADVVFYANTCSVPGREKAHDPMVFTFSFVPQTEVHTRAWEPASGSGPSSGATGHADASFVPKTEVFTRASEPASGSGPSSGATEHPDAKRPRWGDEAVSEDSHDVGGVGSLSHDGRLHQLEADAVSEVCSEADFSRDPSEHSDDEGVSEQAQQDHFDELATLGFALAKSAAVLPQFSTKVPQKLPATSSNAQDCIDGAWLKPMTGACTASDRESLSSCMKVFFTNKKKTRLPVDKDAEVEARVFKTPDEIMEAWDKIFGRRRLFEPNDRQPIEDPEQLAAMWTSWQRDWIKTEATDKQKKKDKSKQTSIFNAWAYQNVGGLPFVMAAWQTGMSWAPPLELLNSNTNGALEHVATHFASWTRQLARATNRHKSNPQTVAARFRSGSSFGRHGLTPQEEVDRSARWYARSNYYTTVQLLNRLQASKGESKGKGKGAAGILVAPKAWGDMSRHEQWWINEYYNGNLLRAMNETQSKCRRAWGKVQAPRFFLEEIPPSVEISQSDL